MVGTKLESTRICEASDIHGVYVVLNWLGRNARKRRW